MEAGSLRSLQAPAGLIDFASNDYLGFAGIVPEEPSRDASGSTGSRLISGNHPLYGEAEKLISGFHLSESALIFNSGYDANLGMLSSVLQRNDYIFYDQRVHASIRDGIALGKARAFNFAHNDLDALRKKVRQVLGSDHPGGAEVYIITESVFSMEGDGPDLTEMARYCREHGFHLIVDEAHAIGVLGPEGRGAVVEASCQEAVFARVITFGKALGCHGAAVLGGSRLREYLLNFSRSLIYTTALPPAGLRAILQSYRQLMSPSGETARSSLQRNILLFREQVMELGLSSHFKPSCAAVRSCQVTGNSRVKAIAASLRDSGFDVKPILSPTVPAGEECLRFSIHAFNTPSQIREVLTILARDLSTLKNE